MLKANHTLYSRSLSPQRVVGILALTSLSFFYSLAAQACSCQFYEEKGFIHGSGRLPSNARGALFRVPRLQGQISYQADLTVFNVLPPEFNAKAFIIRDLTTGTVVPALIEPVQLYPDQETTQKAYFSADQALSACLPSHDRASCRAAGVDLDRPDWKQTLVASGRLRDVSNLAASSGQLFRVRPESGFQEGHRYDIQYQPQQASELKQGKTAQQEKDNAILIETASGKKVPFVSSDRAYQIKVEVDKPLVNSAQDVFSVARLGPLKRESIAVSAGGSCSASFFGTSQMLRYELPSQYEAYRNSMVYFTEAKFPSSNAESASFQAWYYSPSLCSGYTLGGSNVGVSQEKIYTSCSTIQSRSGKLDPSFVRGRVGFLEMGDTLFQTPELMVELDDPKLGPCSPFEALNAAIRTNDQEAITNYTCAMTSEEKIPLPKEMYARLKLLLKLSQNPQQKTRMCAIAGSLSYLQFLQRERANLETARQRGTKIDDAMIRFTSLSDYEIFDSLFAGIEMDFLSEDTKAGTQSVYLLRDLLSALQNRGSLKLSSDEMKKVHTKILRFLESALRNEDKLKPLESEFQSLVHFLGTDAKPLVPALLQRFNTDKKRRYWLLPTLAYCGYDNPEVFKTLVRLFKEENEYSAINALVMIGRGGKTEVADIFMASLKAAPMPDYGTVRALGELGGTAMAAIPLLYDIAHTTRDPSIKQAALLAIAKINPNEPSIIKEIAQEIAQPMPTVNQGITELSSENISIFYLDALAKFGNRAQTALPALKKRLEAGLTRSERQALKHAILAMQLDPKELEGLLKQLD